ncbi:MAG: transaldolase, partial [Actinomycetota bacterium]|jgi:transaldolase|nr:transaldolase [Actinomycetota bacterium]
MADPLAELSAAGVSIWLDDLSRERLRTGNLEQLVRDKHIVGVTTNPSIFQKAMSEGDAYDEQLRDLALRGTDVGEAVRNLQAYDVRWGCDVLRDVYDRTDGVDGRVSYEVDPRIAHDTDRTVAEAKALWWLVDRPNMYIKIPATREGLPAITQTLAAGVSVNVTLIFSLERYDRVMEAFLDGMEQANANGHDLSRMGSVASFFVSRVDTEIDKRLEKTGGPKELRGKAAIANAQLAYQHYEKVFSSDRWKALEKAGAKPQRPLWASTGVKDPAYDDTQYVVELVARGTVNTMPEPTLDAVADHGVIRGDTVTGSYAEAQKVLDDLKAAGIDYDDVVELLEVEGVQKFEDAWNELIESVTANLEKAGASIDADGAASPAGSGPAAASRAGSA